MREHLQRTCKHLQHVKCWQRRQQFEEPLHARLGEVTPPKKTTAKKCPPNASRLRQLLQSSHSAFKVPNQRTRKSLSRDSIIRRSDLSLDRAISATEFCQPPLPHILAPTSQVFSECVFNDGFKFTHHRERPRRSTSSLIHSGHICHIAPCICHDKTASFTYTNLYNTLPYI